LFAAYSTVLVTRY